MTSFEPVKRPVPEAAERPRATIHLPRPTAWPMLVAGGITMVMAGLIVSPFFDLVGIVVFGLALRGWIEEMRNESDE